MIPSLQTSIKFAPGDTSSSSCSGSEPRSPVFDLRTGKRESVVDLARFLPKHFFRNPPDSDCDPFHFNSLTFTATRAFALAHNWSQPSFALELALPLFGMRHLMRQTTRWKIGCGFFMT